MNVDERLEAYLFKEIDIIQDLIRRMAFNSFLIKGWAVTLVVITLLLKGGADTAAMVFLPYLPLIAFWFLDAYFLRQERLYRKLYDWVTAPPSMQWAARHDASPRPALRPATPLPLLRMGTQHGEGNSTGRMPPPEANIRSPSNFPDNRR